MRRPGTMARVLGALTLIGLSVTMVAGPSSAQLFCDGKPAVEVGNEGFVGTDADEAVVVTESGFPRVVVRMGGGNDRVCLQSFVGIEVRLGGGNDGVFVLPDQESDLTNVWVYGGAGDDQFFVWPGVETEAPGPLPIGLTDRPEYHGGPGHDLISFETYSCGLNIDLDRHNGGATPRSPLGCPFGIGFLVGAKISNFEDATGTDKDDEILGNGAANTLRGLRGGDRLEGKGGDDILWGGADGDRMWGNGGDDYIAGGHGRDHGWGGYGADTLTGDEDGDNLYGGAGADRLHGFTGDDLLDGNGGLDSLYGGLGHDTCRRAGQIRRDCEDR